MTRIRVGIRDKHSIEVDIDKSYEEIEISDIFSKICRDGIHRDQKIIGWCRIEGVDK